MFDGFLPITPQEMQALGWDAPDFILVTGDAYVDHPSFGAAIIARLLERAGFRICILPQPDFKSAASFRIFGRPKLGFLVTAGNLDSMVNNYTAALKKRKEDVYAPGCQAGLRPDRALITYAIKIREAFGRIPIIAGGLEASLRRLAHYDYWQNKIRRSILVDASLDLLVYGMGEHSILEIAYRLKDQEPIENLKGIRGTVQRALETELPKNSILLPTFNDVKTSPQAFATSFKIQYQNTDPFTAYPLAESYGDFFVLQNPPSLPLTTEELDDIYELPFQRTYHPYYLTQGGIKALTEVRFSLVAHRGCFGGCTFCSLTFHQGRIIQRRSLKSLLNEAEKLTRLPDFKGYIHDVGGPTANFHLPACQKQEREGACVERLCLFPKPCPKLNPSHREYLQILRAIRKLPNVKKVFIRSGIRFDFLLLEKDMNFFRELCDYHVSGQLKVAPEHVSDSVLRLMHKPPHQVYQNFCKKFYEINENLGKKQFLVPYFISGHPGSKLSDAIELAEFFRQTHFIPEQVQDFYPTPGTLATCMYYTGIHPLTGEKVYVAKTRHEKALQRALLQYHNPKNYALVKEALLKAGRKDLIGYGPKCLIKPHRERKVRDAKRGFKAHN